MSQKVARGSPITLDAFYRDASGNLVVPVTPTVEIFDPNNMSVYGPVTPTLLGVGHYQVTYTVPLGAPLGAHTAHWCGTINSVSVCDDEQFDVVLSGSISFLTTEQVVCAPWATPEDVCSPCNDYVFDQLVLTDMLQVASDLLYQMSGEQFSGVCSDTVRPCGRRLRDDRPAYHGVPYNWSNSWQWWEQSWGWCRCNRPTQRNGAGCGCNGPSEITLGAEPITHIDQVKIDGVVLDPSSYRIDDERWLVRLPDVGSTQPQTWPCCQRMDLPATEEGTFEVSFQYGRAPTAAGVHAAAVLGCELALLCDPETAGQCRLPQRVTSLTRQGISEVMLDPFDFLDNGRTGLIEIDLFLHAENPNRLQRSASVMSPDLPRPVRRVTG